MARALLPIFPAVVLFAGLTVACSAAAGGPAGGARPATNSFTLLATGPGPKAPSGGQSNGVGVGPSKPVVSNPYNVPLLQNAGTLRAR